MSLFATAMTVGGAALPQVGCVEDPEGSESAAQDASAVEHADEDEAQNLSIEEGAIQTSGSANEHTSEPASARLTPCNGFLIVPAQPNQPVPFPNDISTMFMVPSGANGETCSLLQGDHNSAVFALQRTLQICYGQSISLDSDFGPLTKAALARAQRAIGVQADGEYGFITHSFMKFPRIDGLASFNNCMRVL
jgi:peptidoglycan hydrolase-like protein with peptidoglycan-binding domain